MAAQIVQVQSHQGRWFVWVKIAFLLMSQQGAASPQVDRTAGGQPRLHQMTVLLVHDPASPFGWQVSNYALDQAGLPAIEAEP